MGKTVNEIIINKNIDLVFDISNNISDWKNLFNEYSNVEVLQKREGYIKFRLTKELDDGSEKSWVSERYFDKRNYIIHARRIEPLFPFRFMNITWEYEKVDDSTKMVWIQEFELDPNCKFSDSQMEEYLNNGSKIEMETIKNKIQMR